MSEKRLNNTIFLMHEVTAAFIRSHAMSIAQFSELDRKYDIIGFIGNYPDIFDSMSESEMVRELEEYIAHAA